jgi:hypothetical protein
VRIIIRFVALLSLAASASPAQTLSPGGTRNTSDSLTLIALEKAWCDATISGDTTVVQNLLAPAFVGQSSRGRKVTKNDEIAEIRNRSETSHNSMCEHRDSGVHLYGDVAIVTAHTFTSGVRNGTPFADRHAVSMDTYLRIGGRWLCISSFAALVPSP